MNRRFLAVCTLAILSACGSDAPLPTLPASVQPTLDLFPWAAAGGQGLSACFSDDHFAANPLSIASVSWGGPANCEPTFNGQSITVQFSLIPKIGAPLFGVNGETRPWTIEVLKRKPGSLYETMIDPTDLPGINASCYAVYCPLAVQFPLEGNGLEYTVWLRQSDGEAALALVITPSELEAGMSGPQFFEVGQPATYYATPSGGGSPYSHTWYIKFPWDSDFRGSGTGSPHTLSLAVCGWFELRVVTTAANGEQASYTGNILAQNTDPLFTCLEM
jgi:hypothetical protein